jgi:hypothetical protein
MLQVPHVLQTEVRVKQTDRTKRFLAAVERIGEKRFLLYLALPTAASSFLLNLLVDLASGAELGHIDLARQALLAAFVAAAFVGFIYLGILHMKRGR